MSSPPPGWPPNTEIREVVQRAHGWDVGERFNYAMGGERSTVVASTATVGQLFQIQHGERIRSIRLIHKAIHNGTGDNRWPASDEPSDPMYWRREALAYESGLLDELDMIVAPRCFGTFERDDGTIGIWLEDVGGDPAMNWSLDRLALAARQLGRMQGSFLTERPLPDQSWLARDWLAAYVARREAEIVLLDDDNLWAHPLARTFLGDLNPDVWRQVWRERQRYLDALRASPKTLTHNDFWGRNLFGRGGVTVAIDWAYVGIGAVGEDIGNLIGTGLLDGFVSPAAAKQLWARTSRAYLRGLREAGWGGDSRVVMLGIALAIALKFCWMLGHMLRLCTEAIAHRAIEESDPWGTGSVSLLDHLGASTGGRPRPRMLTRSFPPTDVERPEELPGVGRFFARRAAVLRFLEEVAAEAERLLRAVG